MAEELTSTSLMTKSRHNCYLFIPVYSKIPKFRLLSMKNFVVVSWAELVSKNCPLSY